MKKFMSVISVVLMVMLADPSVAISIIEDGLSSAGSYSVEDDLSSSGSFSVEDEASSAGSFSIESDLSSSASSSVEEEASSAGSFSVEDGLSSAGSLYRAVPERCRFPLHKLYGCILLQPTGLASLGERFPPGPEL